VIGLDLSEAMLREAAANTSQYLQTGQARFIQGDAAHFTLGETVGMAVSTYNSLNQLADIAALEGCFRSVWNALVAGGVFLFDIHTRTGLQSWNSTAIEDSPELMLVSHGKFDPAAGQAFLHVTGFARTENGLYERIEQIAHNTLFDLEEIRALLLALGWRDVYLASGADLSRPVADPENERRVFFIARKPG